MPISIRPIGTFFPQDDEGYILNPTAWELIPAHWLPVIELIKSNYLEQLGINIHSIYLRGSLPRGQAVDGFSDIDTFALVKNEPVKWKPAPWQATLTQQLQQQFSFVREVETMLAGFETPFSEKNPQLSMIIQTQSLCLFGPSIASTLSSFKPNQTMMIHYRWLKQDVEDFLKKDNFQIIDIQNIMKIILRSGFELVMKQEEKYTTDLYLCYHTFSKYYPHFENSMRQALYLYLNPSTDVSFLKKFVRNFGTWLTDELRVCLKILQTENQ